MRRLTEADAPEDAREDVGSRAHAGLHVEEECGAEEEEDGEDDRRSGLDELAGEDERLRCRGDKPGAREAGELDCETAPATYGT
jgi:hypothetical protein